MSLIKRWIEEQMSQGIDVLHLEYQVTDDESTDYTETA